MKLLRIILLSALAIACPVLAKDKDKSKPESAAKKSTPITLAQCPAPVQATIQGYKGTVNELETEVENGVTAYDAKITLADGRRIKLLIGADGSVLDSKEKKAK